MNNLIDNDSEALHTQILMQSIELRKLRKSQRISNAAFLLIFALMTECFFYIHSINNRILNVLYIMIGDNISEIKSIELKPPHKKIAVD